MSQTKHQQVIAHIESLTVGEKVSVRQLARELGVSEGTVYRAIKETENQGYVTSIPKVGTLRIEKKKDRTIESLTYHELSLLLEGRFLSGVDHKDDVPKNYYVALRTADLDSARVSSNTLLITSGNEEIIRQAVKRGIPILVAGHENISNMNFEFHETDAPIVLVCPHQIFELISTINKTIFERVKRRDFVMVSDVMSEKPFVMQETDCVGDYFRLSKSAGHSRFPVLNEQGMLVGLCTARHVANQSEDMLIREVMQPHPVVAKPDDMMSYLARLFVLEEAEIIPILSLEDQLVGVVTRQDVIEALQTTQKQPQFGDAVDILVLSGFDLKEREPEVEIVGPITDFMLDETGEASIGNLTIIATNAATIAVRLKENLIYQAVQVNTQVYEPIVEDMVIHVRVSLYMLRGREVQATVRLISEGVVVGLSTMLLLPTGK